MSLDHRSLATIWAWKDMYCVLPDSKGVLLLLIPPYSSKHASCFPGTPALWQTVLLHR